MPGNKSTHIPAYAGGIETVPSSGSVVVDTGLREVQGGAAALAEDSVATAAGVSIAFAAPVGGSVKATIKTWAADGSTAGSTAAKVGWTALGK